MKLGKDVKLAKFINLYGCEIGDETKIGAFVEIQKNATVGKRCKISSHTFICEGVTIEDHVFIGHGVTFINDSYPRATTPTGELQTEQDWKVEPTLVKKGASIGSGATILSKRRHRRARHRRRRQRRHTRRAPSYDRRRQPGASLAASFHRTRESRMSTHKAPLLDLPAPIRRSRHVGTIDAKGTRWMSFVLA